MTEMIERELSDLFCKFDTSAIEKLNNSKIDNFLDSDPKNVSKAIGNIKEKAIKKDINLKPNVTGRQKAFEYFEEQKEFIIQILFDF